jgi:hypothetical protein
MVETKDEMKKHFGKSPDLADAAFILVDLCRERFGFGANAKTQTPALASGDRGLGARMQRLVSACRGKRNLRLE